MVLKGHTPWYDNMFKIIGSKEKGKTAVVA
jgi:hypothetical protein